MQNDVIRKTDALIQQHGFTVIYVMADANAPSFAYTVGLAEQGLPEVIIAGLDYRVAQPVLSDVASRLRAKTLVLSDNLRDSKTFEKFEAMFKKVPLATATDYVLAAIARLERTGSTMPLFVFQLQWPDPNGVFPDDAECDPRYAAVQRLARAH